MGRGAVDLMVNEERYQEFQRRKAQVEVAEDNTVKEEAAEEKSVKQEAVDGKIVKEEIPERKPVKEEAAEGKNAKVPHGDDERTAGEDQEDGTSKE
jgi:hypothetical protein